MFHDTHNTGNALGAGLQAAFKLIVRLSSSGHSTFIAVLTRAAMSDVVPRRRKSCMSLCVPPKSRTRSPQEPRRQQDPRYFERVDPLAGPDEFLQVVRDRVFEESSFGRHVVVLLGLHRCFYPQSVSLHYTAFPKTRALTRFFSRVCRWTSSVHWRSDLLLSFVQRREIRGRPQVRPRVWDRHFGPDLSRSCYACSCFERCVPSVVRPDANSD